MSDQPSRLRGLVGRGVDFFMPGDIYNNDTGQYSNVGKSFGALGLRTIAGLTLGPGGAFLAGKFGNNYVDGSRWDPNKNKPPTVANYEGFGGTAGSDGYRNVEGPGQTAGNGGSYGNSNPYASLGPAFFNMGAPRYSSDNPFRVPQTNQNFWSYQRGGNQLGFGGTPASAPSSAQAGSAGGVMDGGENGGGCVTIESFVISDRGVIRAGDVKVGDKLQVIDPVTHERSWAEVSHSETMPQPCVAVSAGGVELDCSETAPIANVDGLQVKAPSLGGEYVPVVVDGTDRVEVADEPKSIGTQLVQKITCEDRFFLAGKTKDRYLLHHNVKATRRGVAAPARGPIASYNMMPNTSGLKWGW